MTVSAISVIQALDRSNRHRQPAKPRCACPTCGQSVNDSDRVRVNVDTGDVLVFGHRVKLTPKEAMMLKALADRYPNVIHKGSLMDLIYDMETEQPDWKILAVYVFHLRRKLAGTGLTIKTHYGCGYSLQEVTGNG